MIRTDLGAVTAYAYAVDHDYTGTEAQFGDEMANIANNSARLSTLENAVDTLDETVNDLSNEVDSLYPADTALSTAGKAADAAKVGTELSKKLGYVSVLNSSHDLDDFKETGSYLWLSGNRPTNSPVSDSNCIMNVIHAFGSNGFVLQTVHSNSGKMYQRMMGSTSWLAWFEISPTSAVAALNEEIDKKLGYVAVLTSADNLDNFTETGSYLWLSNSHPSGVPDTTSNSIMNVIHAFHSNGFVLQTVHTNTGKMYQRMMTSSSWLAWVEISAGSGGGGGTVIENTYNISTSPHITTDSNGWLQSVDTDTADESGKTDMTGAIMSMLQDTGYCHLGEGIFYVSGNIDMPEHSMLCGCGDKTVIRLLQSTTTGYCVKLQKFCTIKDVSFSGARSFSMPSSKGTRNGIEFTANYDGTDSGAQTQTDHCFIENVWVRNFTGDGIRCHNTSIRYDRGLYATNVFIDSCYVGLDIDYYSEFNKFANVCTSWCYYGCINNGGNNVFTSCTFHAANTGFYIDGTKPNHGHGTINGCTFCHIGNNSGSAITLSNVTNGFVIDACQIWYNSLDMISCQGIVVSNCELGRGTTGAGATININGGALISFVGNVFMNDSAYAPDINITNNNKVKFVACFGSASGNEITAA